MKNCVALLLLMITFFSLLCPNEGICLNCSDSAIVQITAKTVDGHVEFSHKGDCNSPCPPLHVCHVAHCAFFVSSNYSVQHLEKTDIKIPVAALLPPIDPYLEGPRRPPRIS